ncbi:MAG: aminotransferase class III-fold pyridoxal phosphate-dependent enzyme [Pyrinomonadaceae bacterium]|nr:aminotransferase class III-fold pyridoxal phosphate-dependent enzyme [Pyrinomonadaceae bacterium]
MSTEIRDLVSRHYSLKVKKIDRLEGFGSENYKISSDAGTFVLKFYRADQDTYLRELLEAENLYLQKLGRERKGFFPIPQEDKSRDCLSYSESKQKYFRLLTFLEGELFAEVEHSDGLLRSYGKAVGEMNAKAFGFRHIATETRKFEWDLNKFELSRECIRFIENLADRKLVEYYFLKNKEHVQPKLEQLRKCVIHGDVNSRNVVTKNGEVSGIFDFGDINYTALINELAIAATYGLFGKEDIIGAAAKIVEGYHEVCPLDEIEIEVLYWLIATRASINVCQAAKIKHEGRNSEYSQITVKPAWDVLTRWIRINPLRFEDAIRTSVGYGSRISSSIAPDIEKRSRHTSKALSLQFSEPIKMTGAAFQYMYDASGKTYLDCYNNIPQVGHCHPHVVEAGQRAMAQLNTNTRYLNDFYNEYAENLLEKFPENLTKVFFVNSGSAASDLAIRLAMAHTAQQGIVVMEHGYHGNTRVGIDISHYKYNRKGGTGKSDAILEAEIPDTYKGRFRNNDGTAGRQYAQSTISKLNDGGMKPAAFIAEPIVGCGGQIPLAKDYLKELYPFIREQGGVCISDEVQTGFGRLGKYFWGFGMHDVVPDIVVIGKPMGNGHPLAAVVTTDEIAESFETGMEFFSSFGGNPVSCAIGQAVLDVLDEEKLPENAKTVGVYLLELLEELVGKYEVCGDARGEGLFLGLELVIDEKSKKPNRELASLVQNKLKKQGIMVGTDGPFVNVIKVKPPICFTKENADELARAIHVIIRGVL